MRGARAGALAVLGLLAGCRAPDGGPASTSRMDALEARVAALEARLADVPAASSGLDGASWEELAARLDSSQAIERLRAGEALAGRLSELRVDALRVAREGTIRQREAIAVVLSREAVADMATDLLLAQAAATEPRVRAWLDLALGRSGASDATPVLVQDLWHADASVQVAAAQALGRLGDPLSAGALARRATDSGGLGAEEAARALRRLGDAAAPALAAEWPSHGPRERQAMLVALQRVEGPAMSRFLRERLEDPDPLVALEAARVLAARGDEAGRALALERLKSDDPSTARAARAALDAWEPAPEGAPPPVATEAGQP